MTAPDPAVIGSVPAVPPDGDQPAEQPTSTPTPKRKRTRKPKPPQPPTRKPSCTPDGGYGPLTPIFQKLQRARKRRLFVLVEQGRYGITPSTLEAIYSWRKEIKTVASKGGVDILVHSPGGILTTCYQIARLFTASMDEWEALIPELAASGATLISLASSNIVLGDMAHLGPVDPQVLSRRHDKLFVNERQSPLEAFEALKYLRQVALAGVTANLQMLLELGIATKPALDHAVNLAHHLVQPIIAKIEPYDVGAFALDSRLSQVYSERVAKPANQAKKTQRGVNIRALVENYPAHEFTVDFEEAKALGFNVCEASDDIGLIFDEIRTELEKTDVRTYIGLVPEEAAR